MAQNFSQELDLILRGDVTDAVAKIRVLTAETRQAMSAMRADIARTAEAARQANTDFANDIRSVKEVGNIAQQEVKQLAASLQVYDKEIAAILRLLDTEMGKAAKKAAADLKGLEESFLANDAQAKKLRDSFMEMVASAEQSVAGYKQNLGTLNQTSAQAQADLRKEFTSTIAAIDRLQTNYAKAAAVANQAFESNSRQISTTTGKILTMTTAVETLTAAERKAEAEAKAMAAAAAKSGTDGDRAAAKEAADAFVEAQRRKQKALIDLDAQIQKLAELEKKQATAATAYAQARAGQDAQDVARDRARADRLSREAALAKQTAEQRLALERELGRAQAELADIEAKATAAAAQHDRERRQETQQRSALEREIARQQQDLVDQAAKAVAAYAGEYNKVEAELKQYISVLQAARDVEEQLRIKQRQTAQDAVNDIKQQREAHRDLEEVTQRATATSAKMSLAIRQGNADALRSVQTLLGPLGGLVQPFINMQTHIARTNAALAVLPPAVARPAQALGILGSVAGAAFGVVSNVVGAAGQAINTLNMTVVRGAQTYQAWAQQTGQIAIELRTLQQITGMNVREAGALQAAFQALGQPAFIVNAALATLSVQAGKNEETFRRMNVSIRDAKDNLLPTRDILLQLADSYEKAANKQEAIANIGKIFSGWMAGSMIPVLALGREGIESLTAYMTRLGLSMDEVSRDKAIAAKNAFQLFGLTIETLKRTIVVGFAPAVITALTAIIELTPKITAYLAAAVQQLNGLVTGLLGGMGVKISAESKNIVDSMLRVVGAGNQVQETAGSEAAALERLRNELKETTRAHQLEKQGLEDSANALKAWIKDTKEAQDAVIKLAEKGLRTLNNEMKALNREAKDALKPFKDDVEDASQKLEQARGKLSALQRDRNAERTQPETQKENLSTELDSVNRHLQNMRVMRDQAFNQLDKDINTAKESVNGFRKALDDLELASKKDLQPLRDGLQDMRDQIGDVERLTRNANQEIARQKRPWQDVIDTSNIAIRDLREAHEAQIATTKAGLESMRNFIAELKEQEQGLLNGIDKTITKLKTQLAALEEKEKATLKPWRDQLDAINDQIDMLREQSDADERALEARVEALRRQQREMQQALAADQRHPESNAEADEAAIERAQRLAEITGELADAQQSLSAAQQALTRNFEGELQAVQSSLTMDREKLRLMEQQNEEAQRARQLKQAELALADLLGESDLGRLRKERAALDEADQLHRRQGESRSEFNKRVKQKELDDQIKAIEAQRQLDAAKQAVDDQHAKQQYDNLRKDLQDRIAQEQQAADAISQAWKDAREAQTAAQQQINALTKEQNQLQKEAAKSAKEAATAAKDAIADIQDLKDAESDRLKDHKAASEAQIASLEAQTKSIERQIRNTEKLYTAQKDSVEADLKKQETARRAVEESYTTWVGAVQVQATAAEKAINQAEVALNAKIRPIEATITTARTNLETIDKEWAPTLLHLQNLKDGFTKDAENLENRLRDRERYWRPRILEAQSDYDKAQQNLANLELDRHNKQVQWDAWMEQPTAHVASLQGQINDLDAQLTAIDQKYRPLLQAAQDEVADAEARLQTARNGLQAYEAAWQELRDTKQGEIDAKQEEIANLREERDNILQPMEDQLRGINEQIDAIDSEFTRQRARLEEEIQEKANSTSNYLKDWVSKVEDAGKAAHKAFFDSIFGGGQYQNSPEEIANMIRLDPDAAVQANMDPATQKWYGLGKKIGQWIRDGFAGDHGWQDVGKSIGGLIADGIKEGIKAGLKTFFSPGTYHNPNDPSGNVPASVPQAELATRYPNAKPYDPQKGAPSYWSVIKEAYNDVGIGGMLEGIGLNSSNASEAAQGLVEAPGLFGTVVNFGADLARMAWGGFRKATASDPDANRAEHQRTYDTWSAQSSVIAQESIKKLFAEPVASGTTDVFQGGLATGLGAVKPPDEAFRGLVGGVGQASDRAFQAGQRGLSEDIKATITSSVIGGTDDTTTQLTRGFHDARFANLADALRSQTVDKFGDVAKSDDKDRGLRGGWGNLLLTSILDATEDAVSGLNESAALRDTRHLGGLAAKFSDKVTEIFRTAFTGIKQMAATDELAVPLPGSVVAPTAAAVERDGNALQQVIRDMLVDSLTHATEDATTAVPEKVAPAAKAFADAIADQVKTKLNDATTPVLNKFKDDITGWWNDGVVKFLESATPWNATIEKNWTDGYKGEITKILDSLVKPGETADGALPQWNHGLLTYLETHQKPWTDKVKGNWESYRDAITGEGTGIFAQISSRIDTAIGSSSGSGSGLLGKLGSIDPWAAVQTPFGTFETNVFDVFKGIAGLKDAEGGKGIAGYAQDAVTAVGAAFNGLSAAVAPGLSALESNTSATVQTVAGIVNELGRQLLGTESILDVSAFPAPSSSRTSGGGSSGGGGGGGGGTYGHGALSVTAGHGTAVGGPMIDGALGAFSMPTIPPAMQSPGGRSLPVTDDDIEKLVAKNYEWIASNRDYYSQYLDDTSAGAAALWGQAMGQVGYNGGPASPAVDQLTGGAAIALSMRGQDQVKRWLDILSGIFGEQIWDWPVHGKLEQEFGYTEFARGRYANDLHTGVDLGVPSGTPIHAPYGGKIIGVRDDGAGGYGYHVIVEHDPNLTSLFAHMTPGSAKPVGTVLAQGDVLGLSDNTGNSTGPHLHWGVMQNGEWVDPLARITQSALTTKPSVPSTYGQAPAHKSVVVPPGVSKGVHVMREYGYNHMSLDDLMWSVQESYPPPSWFTSALFQVNNEKFHLAPRQLRALATLAWLESDYVPGVLNNEGSGAKGLFQLMPDNRQTFGVVDGDVKSEIEGGIRYILARVQQQGGSPVGSLDFWLNNGWYRNGGLAGLQGPELATVGHGAEFVLDATTTKALARQGLLSMQTGTARQVAPEFVAAIEDGRVARSISTTTYNGPSSTSHNSVVLNHYGSGRGDRTLAQEQGQAELMARRVAGILRG